MKDNELIPYSGQSMYPCLMAGDLLIVEWESEDISNGDVLIALDDEKKIIAHRWIESEGKLKGDRSLGYDTEKNILGKVIGVERKKVMLNWSNGQPLRNIISLLSKYNLEGLLVRKIIVLLIILISFCSIQISKKSSLYCSVKNP